MKHDEHEVERYPPQVKSRKVLECGNVTEVTALSWIPKATIQRLDKDHYIVISEDAKVERLEDTIIHTYKHNEKKIDNVHSVRQSIARMRRVINTNCVNPAFVRWVTLTYAENMQDLKRLYDDYKKFNMRLRYYFDKEYDGLKYEYIAVPEPQERGAWHLHVIMIFDRVPPYISNNEVIYKTWGHGFTSFQAVDNCDNLGAYLSAYLSDLPVDVRDGYQDNTIVDKQGKKYIKGGRLTLYPQNMKLYRISKGIKQPKEIKITSDRTYSEYIRDKGAKTYEYTSVVENDERDLYIQKQFYNKKRSKSNEN